MNPRYRIIVGILAGATIFGVGVSNQIHADSGSGTEGYLLRAAQDRAASVGRGWGETGVEGYLLRAAQDRAEEIGRNWENSAEKITIAQPASAGPGTSGGSTEPEVAGSLPASYPQTAEGENYHNFREEHGLGHPAADWTCGGHPLGGDWHAVHGGQYDYIAGYENATEAQKAAEFCQNLVRSDDKIYAAWADINQRIDTYYDMWNWDGSRDKRNFYKFDWVNWNYVVGRIDHKMSVKVGANIDIPEPEVEWFEGRTEEYYWDAFHAQIRQYAPGVDLGAYFNDPAARCEITETMGPANRDLGIEVDCEYDYQPGHREMAAIYLGPAESYRVHVSVSYDEIWITYYYSTWGWD